MTKILFADLTHTGTVIDANSFPLAIGCIAAAAKTALGDAISVELVKYPAALSCSLDRDTPDVAAFSNYMWNERLGQAYATAIKQRHPGTVTIFGGPNYPIDAAEQEAWLRGRPDIDFYIEGEGELAFIALLGALADFDFNVAALKASGRDLASAHYFVGDRFVRGTLLPRIVDLDQSSPSPYLMGLMDGFFDGKLTPLVQTSRGCPYSCTFCHDGIAYATKTRRFSQQRIDAELAYVQQKVTVPSLTLADLNWGMFPEDIETAKTLARMKVTSKWPARVNTATAKNQKKRIIEMARLLGDSMYIGASIQSTDAEVLKNIKRTNIDNAAIVEMAKESRRSNSLTFSELILGLPGDSKEKHFRSIDDMLTTGIEEIHSYQFILLPGTEGANPATRQKFGYQTRFRVLPRCFGRYPVYGGEVPVAEIHEVCVGNDSMSYADYQDCRWFDLTLAIFNNGSIVNEVINLALTLGVDRAQLIRQIHDLAVAPDSPLLSVYQGFRDDEEKNFWDEAALQDFLARPEGFDAYLAGSYGANQIFKYRFQAVFTMLDSVLDIVFGATRSALTAVIAEDARIDDYLTQLRAIILASRSALTEVDLSFEMAVNFDFVTLERGGWQADPRALWSAESHLLRIGHSPAQRDVLNAYFQQYGVSMNGLMYFIHRNAARTLYRSLAA